MEPKDVDLSTDHSENHYVIKMDASKVRHVPTKGEGEEKQYHVQVGGN